MALVYLVGGVLGVVLLLYFFGPKDEKDAKQNENN